MTVTSSARRLSRHCVETVQVARSARVSLLRVVELVGGTSRQQRGIDHDGFETYDRVRLSPDERLEQMRIALAWVQRAENELREVRLHIERALDNNGWRLG